MRIEEERMNNCEFWLDGNKIICALQKAGKTTKSRIIQENREKKQIKATHRNPQKQTRQIKMESVSRIIALCNCFRKHLEMVCLLFGIEQ